MNVHRSKVASPLMLLLLLIGAGCGGIEDRRLGMVTQVSTDGRSVYINVGSCNGNPTVEVVEHPAEVIVRARGSDTSDDCLDGVCIELENPLGDRPIIDRTTGEAVRIEPFDYPFDSCNDL